MTCHFVISRPISNTFYRILYFMSVIKNLFGSIVMYGNYHDAILGFPDEFRDLRSVVGTNGLWSSQKREVVDGVGLGKWVGGRWFDTGC